MRLFRLHNYTLPVLANGLFMASVVAIATLPSGSLAGIPIKYLLLLLVLGYFVLSAKRLSATLLTHLLGVGGFLLIYAIYGLADFRAYAIGELVLALGAIVLGMLIAHVVYRRGLGTLGILNMYQLSVLALGILKLIILLFYLASPGYEAFMEGFATTYQSITGASFLTMPLPHGLIRIYMQNDLIAAMLPLAIAALRPRGAITSYDRILVLLALWIVVIGFSRYNMACFAVCLLAFLWVDKKGQLFKLMLGLLALAFVVLFFKELWQFVEIRFFSAQNASSDEIRVEQASALMEYFARAPIFGHGLGAYTEDMIRSPVAPFSYEQQILSLLPKFGMLGFAVFACYVSYLILRLAFRRRYLVTLYLGLFLASSLFNPYLFSSNMVVAYALIYYLYCYDGCHDYGHGARGDRCNAAQRHVKKSTEPAKHARFA